MLDPSTFADWDITVSWNLYPGQKLEKGADELLKQLGIDRNSTKMEPIKVEPICFHSSKLKFHRWVGPVDTYFGLQLCSECKKEVGRLRQTDYRSLTASPVPPMTSNLVGEAVHGLLDLRSHQLGPPAAIPVFTRPSVSSDCGGQVAFHLDSSNVLLKVAAKVWVTFPLQETSSILQPYIKSSRDDGDPTCSFVTHVRAIGLDAETDDRALLECWLHTHILHLHPNIVVPWIAAFQGPAVKVNSHVRRMLLILSENPGKMKGYPRSGKGDCFISHQHKREIVRMYRVLHEAGVLHTAEKDQQRHWLSMPTPALKQLNLKYATSQKPTGRKSKTEPTQPTANPIRLTDFTRSRVCNSVKYVPPSLRWSALDQHDFDSFTKCEGGEWGYVVYDLGMNPSEARELYQDT